MMRRTAGFSVAAMLLGLLAAAPARADSAADARAMLDRAVAAIKVNPSAALEAFVKGTDGFRQGDLYPFCARARSGVVVAHPSRLGENLANESDKNGKLFGKEILRTAVEGKISELHYMWPKPDQTTPVQKDTFYTKVKGFVCGVGYYK